MCRKGNCSSRTRLDILNSQLHGRVFVAFQQVCQKQGCGALAQVSLLVLLLAGCPAAVGGGRRQDGTANKHAEHQEHQRQQHGGAGLAAELVFQFFHKP